MSIAPVGSKITTKKKNKKIEKKENIKSKTEPKRGRGMRMTVKEE